MWSVGVGFGETKHRHRRTLLFHLLSYRKRIILLLRSFSNMSIQRPQSEGQYVLADDEIHPLQHCALSCTLWRLMRPLFGSGEVDGIGCVIANEEYFVVGRINGDGC